MRTQHCSYWCPGAKAPGHQYPQCWLDISFYWYLPYRYRCVIVILQHVQLEWTHCVQVLPHGDRSGSTLAQVMACCLTAPSHHLNLCWLIISSRVLCVIHLRAIAQEEFMNFICKLCLDITLRIIITFTGVSELISCQMIFVDKDILSCATWFNWDKDMTDWLLPWSNQGNWFEIWRLGTRRWNLRVPDLQMSCSDLT